jgi:hypothetical protein
MDRLTSYQDAIVKTLTEVSELLQTSPVEALISIDHAHGQYILIADGWEGATRHYSTLAHIELKPNAEVWLRCDNTDIEVGQMLINQGIAKQDITLAFYSPAMREYAQMV